jgi:hypothetical protein
MTKKSAGRLKRDEMKKQLEANPQAAEAATWDKLTGIYTTCAQALVNNHSNMLRLFAIPGLLQNVPDVVLVEKALTGLDNDVKDFSEELLSIRQLHISKVGDCVDENETMQLFEIFEKYHSYDSRYNAIILPTVMELSEQATLGKNKMIQDLQKAEALAAEELAKKQLVDPNVISDIQIKEHPSTEVHASQM